jgi:DNA-binding NarL/FixJ family response regulator
MGKISLVLADDHSLFCQSLKIVLSTEAQDMEVVGIARDGEEVLLLVDNLRPDLVLMDVRMPRVDGVQATRLIRERYPKTHIMMLTTFDDDEDVRHALEYGAEGYLLKDTPLTNLIAAIRALVEGVVQVSPSVVKKLMGTAHQPDESVGTIPDWVRMLSPREKEILYLIGKGRDNTEISRELFIAEQTVKNHISEIYSKIGVHDRGKAAILVTSLRCDIRLLL